MDPAYAKRIGVDIDNLLVSQPDTGEQALEIAELLIRSGALDVVAIDSVAALTPKAEIEGEMGDSHVGLQARLLPDARRKGSTRCAVCSRRWWTANQPLLNTNPTRTCADTEQVPPLEEGGIEAFIRREVLWLHARCLDQGGRDQDRLRSELHLSLLQTARRCARSKRSALTFLIEQECRGAAGWAAEGRPGMIADLKPYAGVQGVGAAVAWKSAAPLGGQAG